jgi:hypothetical protein
VEGVDGKAAAEGDDEREEAGDESHGSKSGVEGT